MNLRGRVAVITSALRASAVPMALDLMGLGGCGMIVYGVYLIYLPGAFIVAGMMLVTAVWLGARRG